MEGNYFVGTTFAKGEDGLWHSSPASYWPVGGKMDFLAYSLSTEGSNVAVSWDAENAAEKVTLTVSAEESQNDILYASKYAVRTADHAGSSGAAIDMEFQHVQAWLEFAVTGSSLVRLKSIELVKVYNAGTLTISNNMGNAIAVTVSPTITDWLPEKASSPALICR